MLQTARISLGWIWALALVLVGVWTWRHQSIVTQTISLPDHQAASLEQLVRVAAVWLVMAGQFVFVVIVADAAKPNTSPQWRAFFRSFFGSGFYLSLFWIAYLLFILVN